MENGRERKRRCVTRAAPCLLRLDPLFTGANQLFVGLLDGRTGQRARRIAVLVAACRHDADIARIGGEVLLRILEPLARFGELFGNELAGIIVDPEAAGQAVFDVVFGKAVGDLRRQAAARAREIDLDDLGIRDTGDAAIVADSLDHRFPARNIGVCAVFRNRPVHGRQEGIVVQQAEIFRDRFRDGPAFKDLHLRLQELVPVACGDFGLHVLDVEDIGILRGNLERRLRPVERNGKRGENRCQHKDRRESTEDQPPVAAKDRAQFDEIEQAAIIVLRAAIIARKEYAAVGTSPSGGTG